MNSSRDELEYKLKNKTMTKNDLEKLENILSSTSSVPSRSSDWIRRLPSDLFTDDILYKSILIYDFPNLSKYIVETIDKRPIHTLTGLFVRYTTGHQLLSMILNKFGMPKGIIGEIILNDGKRPSIDLAIKLGAKVSIEDYIVAGKTGNIKNINLILEYLPDAIFDNFNDNLERVVIDTWNDYCVVVLIDKYQKYLVDHPDSSRVGRLQQMDNNPHREQFVYKKGNTYTIFDGSTYYYGNCIVSESGNIIRSGTGSFYKPNTTIDGKIIRPNGYYWISTIWINGLPHYGTHLITDLNVKYTGGFDNTGKFDGTGELYTFIDMPTMITSTYTGGFKAGMMDGSAQIVTEGDLGHKSTYNVEMRQGRIHHGSIRAERTRSSESSGSSEPIWLYTVEGNIKTPENDRTTSLTQFLYYCTSSIETLDDRIIHSDIEIPNCVCEYSNGDEYRGLWINGKPSGNGLMRYHWGYSVEGEFVDDVKSHPWWRLDGDIIVTDNSGSQMKVRDWNYIDNPLKYTEPINLKRCPIGKQRMSPQLSAKLEPSPSAPIMVSKSKFLPKPPVKSLTGKKVSATKSEVKCPPGYIVKPEVSCCVKKVDPYVYDLKYPDIDKYVLHMMTTQFQPPELDSIMIYTHHGDTLLKYYTMANCCPDFLWLMYYYSKYSVDSFSVDWTEDTDSTYNDAPDYAKKFVDNLFHSLMSCIRFTHTEDFYVYRGLSVGLNPTVFYPGSTHKLSHFWSSSLKYDVAVGFAKGEKYNPEPGEHPESGENPEPDVMRGGNRGQIIRILIPAGTRFCPILGSSKFTSEEEILLGCYDEIYVTKANTLDINYNVYVLDCVYMNAK